MPFSVPTTLAQISTSGVAFPAKKAPITIENLLAATIGQARDDETVQAVYIHVPFCFHKCHYCDFYSIVDNQDRQEAFVNRLIAEIGASREFVTVPLQSVFVGGGTPTLLAPPLWQLLLEAIHRNLPLSGDCEFTVEANPETVTPELAAALVAGGVNRVSIGCQSFNPRHLKTLERWHDPQNVHRSVAILRDAGFNNFNLDMIFAIPGQTQDEWLADLDEALSLQPTHLSCYGLVYEPNTPLTVKMKAGRIQPAEQELEAAMYAATIDRLATAGFEHYEISNWARRDRRHESPTPYPSRRDQGPDVRGQRGRGSPELCAGAWNHSFRCRHNMIYWHNGNWWPLGPAAAGHFNGLRWKNVPRLGEYLDHSPLGPVADVERLDEDGRIGEEFMLGLRLIEGMDLDRVEELLSRGHRASQRRAALQRRIDADLLERTATHLRFRASGLMLADSVLADLI
jgi:oxygen-independent coproporphyrinogen-3 oxidase